MGTDLGDEADAGSGSDTGGEEMAWGQGLRHWKE
jgi:hypothetical protein